MVVVLSPPQHPVLSNLQILLRQEATDISDPTQLATLLLKKVEVAIAVLPTTPTFRSVALEALLTTFKFCFTHKHTLVWHFISYPHAQIVTTSSCICSLICNCFIVTAWYCGLNWLCTSDDRTCTCMYLSCMYVYVHYGISCYMYLWVYNGYQALLILHLPVEAWEWG